MCSSDLQRHLILGAIGGMLRLDDVVEAGDDDGRPVAHFLLGGTPPPAVVATGAAGRNGVANGADMCAHAAKGRPSRSRFSENRDGTMSMSRVGRDDP